MGQILHKMLGPPSEKMTEAAIVGIKKQVPYIQGLLKRINGEKKGFEDMEGLDTLFMNVREGKLVDRALSIHMDTFIVVAMYQCVFECTFEQATNRYCEMLREHMQRMREEEKEKNNV